MPLHVADAVTRRNHLRALAGLPLGAALFAIPAASQSEDWSNPSSLYTIPGLPQSKFDFNVSFKGAKVNLMRFAGTVGYVIAPEGPADPGRRWVWISPMFLAMNSLPGGVRYQYYVESLAAAGFHVVGLDVGASLGSPAGAELYEKFYREVAVGKYSLNPRARMIGQSNGGLISYGWAFRYPEHVDRIFGILPATDLRSWPGLHKVVGKAIVPQPPETSTGRITPEGLMYPVKTQEELVARLPEFNPIDRLAPLAKAGVKIFHMHGDSDTLVPAGPNSEELVKRYRALGGDAEVEIIKGLGHGGPSIFKHERGLRFLLA